MEKIVALITILCMVFGFILSFKGKWDVLKISSATFYRIASILFMGFGIIELFIIENNLSPYGLDFIILGIVIFFYSNTKKEISFLKEQIDRVQKKASY
jgi:hypothetical protein